MNNLLKVIIAVIAFSIAMAALESAVVVYLRALYYKDGFSVALKVIDDSILKVEVLREFATIVMLVCVGWLAGNNFKSRFAYFLLSFAVWDIFYYLWLKVFINWPSSLFEWDILFLIPVAWLGPVLAPLILSLTMILFALVLLCEHDTSVISKLRWTLIISGSSIVLVSFMIDYVTLISTHDLWNEYPHLMMNPKFVDVASKYLPTTFNWWLFALGEVIILAGIFKVKRSVRYKSLFIQP